MASATAKRGRTATTNLDAMSGVTKSAVLCMALGAERSVRILQMLTASECEVISREIASLPTVGAERVSTVLEEFQQLSRAVESIAHGGLEYATEILEAALGSNKAKAILERIQ